MSRGTSTTNLPAFERPDYPGPGTTWSMDGEIGRNAVSTGEEGGYVFKATVQHILEFRSKYHIENINQLGKVG